MGDKVYILNIHTNEGIPFDNIRQCYQDIMKIGMTTMTIPYKKSKLLCKQCNILSSK